MAINFPNTPANNEVYYDSTSGNRYIYNGAEGVWKFYANTVGVSVSSTPPSNVGEGSMWWNRDTGRMFVYYNDGSSLQWVETTPAPGSIDSGLVASYANAAASAVYAVANAGFTVANSSYTVTNSAFAKANTALQNTSGVFAGSLSLTGNLALGGIATSSIPFETPCDSGGTALKIRGRPSTNDAAIRWYSSDGTGQQGYVQFGGQAEFTVVGPNNFVISSNSTSRMFFNGTTGDVGVGVTGLSTNGVTGRFSILGQNFTNSNETGTLTLGSSDAYSVDKGGTIGFIGKYNSAGAYASFARIYGVKENSTDGNWDGYIGFATPKGGSPREVSRIDSSGNFYLGTNTYPGGALGGGYTYSKSLILGGSGYGAPFIINGGSVAAPGTNWQTVHTFSEYACTGFMLMVSYEDNNADGSNRTAIFVDSGTSSYGAGFSVTRLSGSTQLECTRGGTTGARSLLVRTNTGGPAGSVLQWQLFLLQST